MLNSHEIKVISNSKKFKKVYPHFYHFIMLLLIIVIVIIPILIWLAYFLGKLIPSIITDISAGEVLMYYGSLLAFLGTIALGTLALWQNIQANKINKKLLEQNLIAEHRAYVYLVNFGLFKERKILKNVLKSQSTPVLYYVNDISNCDECLQIMFSFKNHTLEFPGQVNFENINISPIPIESCYNFSFNTDDAWYPFNFNIQNNLGNAIVNLAYNSKINTNIIKSIIDSTSLYITLKFKYKTAMSVVTSGELCTSLNKLPDTESHISLLYSTESPYFLNMKLKIDNED